MPETAACDIAKLRRQLADILPVEGAVPDSALESDPAYFTAYAEMAAAVWNGPHLSRKDKHLICLAANATITALYRPGIARHIDGALEAGAGRPEIVEALKLVAGVSIHSSTVGFPILIEEMARSGRPLDAGELLPEQAAARHAFCEARGGWNPRFEPLARLAPAFLADYAAFSAQSGESGALSPKLREFIYIAIDATATHLFEPGMRVHIRAALGLGAKPEEIAELLALISLSGIQGTLAGLAAISERSPQPEG